MAYPSTSQWSSPLEETNGNARRLAKRSDIYASQERGGQPAAYQQKTIRRTPSDTYNVMSDSEEVKQRRVSLKTNNSITAGKKRSRNTLRDHARASPGDRVDDSAWIHRDKLAQIEIQEMEELGIQIRPSRRSMSADPGASRRSSRSASRSRVPMNDSPPAEPLPNGGQISSYDSYEDLQLYKPLPRTPAGREGERDTNSYVDTEFRTPEEIAAAEFGTARNNTTRPGTSRIPISKASPVPVPPNVVGRDEPLPRSRHGSGAGSGGWDEMQYARRARSGSFGSQALLDDDALRTRNSESSHKQSSAESSPPKTRLAGNKSGASTGGARKASGTNDRPGSSYGKDRKPTSFIPTNTQQRPGSRAGVAAKNGRPSTSHQHTPEGDPPWIDSMYKPDPRLPPDQQMLPTHAKRMLQEQWEKEGKGGASYDRDLNLLTDKTLPAPKAKPNPLNLAPRSPSESPRKLSPRLPPTEPGGAAPPWPSSRGETEQQPPPSPRPSTNGGFKLTPKIAAPPTMQRPSPPPATDVTGQSGTLRVPEMDEKQEGAQGKKRCCCVVM